MKLKNSLLMMLILAGILSCASNNENMMTDYVFSEKKIISIDEIDNNSIILVSTDKIELIFKVKAYDNDNFYAYKIIAANTSKIFLDDFNNINIKDTNIFANGMSMAPTRKGYLSLIINENANHYLFYTKDENIPKRVQLIKEIDSEYLVSFSFDKISINNNEINISEMSGKKLYISCFYDKNLNDLIEPGELKNIVLKFI